MPSVWQPWKRGPLGIWRMYAVNQYFLHPTILLKSEDIIRVVWWSLLWQIAWQMLKESVFLIFFNIDCPLLFCICTSMFNTYQILKKGIYMDQTVHRSTPNNPKLQKLLHENEIRRQKYTYQSLS